MWWRKGVGIVLVACAAAVAQAAPQQAPGAPDLPAGPGSEIATTTCLTCHGPQPIVQQRLSRDGWTREIDKMAGWGAVVDARERDTLLEYFTRHFGPAASVSGALAADDGNGAALLKTRCMACHDLTLIEQQRLTADGWRRELDKMTGWGAVLSPAERDALAAHLARLYRPSVAR